jgi:CheY-like chemotaxis protein
VFANLLNNAAKYTDAGGRIRLAADRQGSDVVISVEDNGIGISADVQPRLFEIFSQVTPALMRSQGGLGIGLSLVRGLVELHGGSASAHSEGPGRGSKFVVRLPLVVETARPARVPEASELTPATPGFKVLVADDNHDAANSLALVLRMMGHDVVTAYDGEQAIETADAFRPDAVLLDIGMPKLNGYEAARRLRQQEWGENILLVALTGWGQEEDRRRTSEAGFDHHLTKPVDAASIESILANRQAAIAESR